MVVNIVSASVVMLVPVALVLTVGVLTRPRKR